MPTITTFSAKFAQPVTLKFQCEYCGEKFESNGEYSTVVRLSKWVPNYQNVNSPDAELLSRGTSNLSAIREFHAKSLKKELITTPLGDKDDKKIQFKKPELCPACGYRQRIGIQPKLSTATIVARVFGLGGCAIFLLFIIGAALSAILQGTATDAAYIFAVVSFLVLVGGSWILLNQNPNQKFMKEHGITKDQLPEPKVPEFVYGPIITKGEYD